MIATARPPHEVLGVPESAPPHEVRRAYRRLALRYHPDRNPGDADAREAFLAVQDAYERLAQRDPDAGFDAERVVAEIQKAAQEAERRRRRGGAEARVWQQVRVELDRSAPARWRATLRVPSVRLGVALGLGLGAATAVALGPIFGASFGVSGWVALVAGAAVGGAVAGRAVWAASPAPWGVETHWQGLRDLRWDVVLSWSEIEGVEEGERSVDLTLTEAAARRLRAVVPEAAFAGPALYRLPLADGARLAALLRDQIADRE